MLGAMTKSAFIERIILVVFIIALVILTAKFLQLDNSGFGLGQINVFVPWGMIAIFISLYLFREYNRVKPSRFLRDCSMVDRRLLKKLTLISFLA